MNNFELRPTDKKDHYRFFIKWSRCNRRTRKKYLQTYHTRS